MKQQAVRKGCHLGAQSGFRGGYESRIVGFRVRFLTQPVDPLRGPTASETLDCQMEPSMLTSFLAAKRRREEVDGDNVCNTA